MSRTWQIAGLLFLISWPGFAGSDLLDEARKELFAARYAHATELYRQVLAQDPAQGEAYYGLVRALLRSHHSAEAYEAADLGLKNAPRSASALTAGGMAEYRRGDVVKSQDYFAAALKIDSKYPGALVGLSSLNRAVSKFKTARDLSLEAYRDSPDDPALMLDHADTLSGPAHIAELERILGLYDAESREARALRVHIASDRALAGRKVRRLTSPYESSRIKLIRLMDSPTHPRGVGLRLQLNGKQIVTLLLDTGASGISLSPKAAAKAGLDQLSDQSSEMNGIGSDRTQDAFRFIASEIRAGDVSFADYPITVFRAAKGSDFDGLIGADVFQRFLVTIDFRSLEMDLEPRQARTSEEAEDSAAPDAGFYRAMRIGNHMAVFTTVNAGPPRLFLVDSGSTQTLIDTDTAREATQVSGGAPVTLRGIQGKVKETSVAQRVTIAFAGFRQENPALLAFNMDSVNDSMGLGLAGILGMPVLDQMRLTIDYRNGTIRMEHRK